MQRIFQSTFCSSNLPTEWRTVQRCLSGALVTLFLMATQLALAVKVEISNPVGFLKMEHNLSMEFETPHTKWAQPYAGGKIRVFFFFTT